MLKNSIIVVGEIMKLFKNANVVNIKNGTMSKSDILVDSGKIVKLEKNIKKDCEEIDLQGKFVLPPFVNAFSNSQNAVRNSFGVDVDKMLCRQLVICKNLLAGAIFLNDNPFVLDEIDQKEEKQLEYLSETAAKENLNIYIKVGQNLDELGTIDKKYGKSAAYVLEDFGFLDRSSVIVGANCFEKDDFNVLKNYDKKVVVLPFEDGRIGRRLTNLVYLKFMNFDVNFGSGDIAEIDFFAYMRQELLYHRALFEDGGVLTERDVFGIACNKKEICVGNFADFVVVSNDNLNCEDVFKTLVWTKSKRDVEMTVYKGEILQKNGKIFMQNLPQYDKIIEMIEHQRRN